MEGIFIPSEFYKDKNLKGMERDVLALYKYYTENGKNKCCSLNNTQIADILNVSTRYLRMVKLHLKELGYIRTDGGIKVIYIGIKVGSTVPQVGSTVPTDRKHSSYQVGSTVPTKQEAQFLHKKEKKDKKEEKKDMTNFEKLIDRLPDYYLTEERMDYLKKNFMDRINDSDISGGVLDSWVLNIKNELNKVFPMDYKVEKVDKKEDSDTVDLFW
jgi:hypothetical protein